MAPRAKPACISTAPDDAAIIASTLFGSDDERKIEARKQVSKTTVLWQHWSPRLKSAIRSDIQNLVPEGSDLTAATIAGYSEKLARIVLRDIGRG